MTPTKVLLVDDEEAFVTAMRRRLEKRNIKVSVALSGRQAIQLLCEDPDVDAVVLDVKMPEMDGIQTLKEIKKLFPGLEVIMLTGHGTFASALEGMKQGAGDYLMKPCDIDELLAKMLEARLRRRQQQERLMASEGRRTARRRSM